MADTCSTCGTRMYEREENGYLIVYCPNCGYSESPLKIGHGVR